MICLKELFKRETLNNQGSQLYKIIREKLINSDRNCLVDFAGVSTVTPLFFQDFIFPLVIEFGSAMLVSRLSLINLKDDKLASYRVACNQTSDYVDKLSTLNTSLFGDLSDISLELLLMARELSRNDLAAAQVIFGINSGMAKSFAAMDIEIIRRIANAGLICFEPRLSPEFAARLAALDASEIDVYLNIAGGLEDVYESRYT